MGRITVLDNPMNPREARTYEHSGPFIDFLLGHFPSGFSGPHVTLLGMDRLAVEDYDRVVGEGDAVTVSVAPAIEMAVVYQVVIATIVAQALNYVINTFFGPKASKPSQPAALDGLPAASPTYSLNTPTNVARIGQPIPVAYGKNPIVPDLAAQPYSWFDSNQMYIGMYLCLGQGEFDIHSVKLANTEVEDMADGIVRYTVFNSAQHRQEFGVMQAAAGVYENLYTSPEVSGQELFGTVGAAYSSSANLWTEDGLAFFRLDADASSYADTIKDGGRDLWAIVTNAGANDGEYLVGYIAYAGQPDYGRKGHLASGTNWATNGNGTIALTYANPATNNPAGPVGPFAATPRGITTSLLSYDIVWPSGNYAVGEKGGLEPFNAAVLFTAEEIDNNGNPKSGGYVSSAQFSDTMATNTPQRRTIWHSVPPGRYRVTGFRTSPASDQASDQSQMLWHGLKAVLGNTMNDTVYGDTTIISMVVKASEGIASDVANRVTVDCTRKINGVASRSPADAFKDILTNARYGGGRPLSELDTLKLADLRAQWESSGKTFDAVFDQHDTLWAALGLSIQMQHAFPTTIGSVVSIVEDKNYVTPAISLTEDTIKDISKQTLFTDGEEPDGVEGEYRDPNDGAALHAIYPTDSVKPESVTLWGCRDYDEALAYVTRRWKQLSLRRCLITVEVEGEGNVIPVGTPVHVTHRLLGENPVLCVVNSVTPKDEFSITLEMHRHVPEVFS